MCLGNWSSLQLDKLSAALTASDTAEAIEAVLFDISQHVVQRIDSIWEQRKQAKFLEAAASLPSADPALLRYFQPKFKPYAPRPVVARHASNGVRLGHIPGVYTSWKDAQLQTIGICNGVKRFKTRKKSDFVASLVTLDQPRFQIRPPQSSPIDRPARRLPLLAGESISNNGSPDQLISEALSLSIPETPAGSEHWVSPTTQQKSVPSFTPCNGSSPPRPTLILGRTITS